MKYNVAIAAAAIAGAMAFTGCSAYYDGNPRNGARYNTSAYSTGYDGMNTWGNGWGGSTTGNRASYGNGAYRNGWGNGAAWGNGSGMAGYNGNTMNRGVNGLGNAGGGGFLANGRTINNYHGTSYYRGNGPSSGRVYNNGNANVMNRGAYDYGFGGAMGNYNNQGGYGVTGSRSIADNNYFAGNGMNRMGDGRNYRIHRDDSARMPEQSFYVEEKTVIKSIPKDEARSTVSKATETASGKTKNKNKTKTKGTEKKTTTKSKAAATAK